jgi:CRISPR-associated endonuclease/helicase Cas3
MVFTDFFTKATTYRPFPYQASLAESSILPTILNAPTGAGKTEAIVLAWLWRRLEHPEQTVRQNIPRRLVYCLPMRALVEQTRDRAYRWLSKLGLSDRVLVTILMGGEERDEWWLRPEQERIIIGTQDMLISRALSRGYASSPFIGPLTLAC